MSIIKRSIIFSTLLVFVLTSPMTITSTVNAALTPEAAPSILQVVLEDEHKAEAEDKAYWLARLSAANAIAEAMSRDMAEVNAALAELEVKHKAEAAENYYYSNQDSSTTIAIGSEFWADAEEINVSTVQKIDDFSDGNMEGWSVIDEGSLAGPSNWSVQNGKLHQSSNIYGPDASATGNRKGTFAYWNDWAAMWWCEYTFGVTINSTDNDGTGVMFRYQDQWNYYKYEMDKQRNFRKLFKVVNGVETTLASVSAGYTQSVDMKLQIVISGNQISVRLDSVDVFGGPISDNDLATGTIALYSWGNEGSIYDNVQVLVASRYPSSEDSLARWVDDIENAGDDAQLANIDLQSTLQKQQEILKMMTKMSEELHDTAMAIIRKMGN